MRDGQAIALTIMLAVMVAAAFGFMSMWLRDHQSLIHTQAALVRECGIVPDSSLKYIGRLYNVRTIGHLADSVMKARP